MNQKIVAIITCTSCPHLIWKEIPNSFKCFLNSNRKVDITDSIPDWCPLPDGSQIHMSAEQQQQQQHLT